MSTDPTTDAANDAARATASRLYTEHVGPLKQYALRLVPESQPSDADDAVHATFEEIVKHLNKGKTIKSPRGLLSKILRTLVYKMFYGNRRFQTIESTLDMDQFAADEVRYSPERSVLAHQQRDAFSYAINQIPKRYRLVFVMRRVYGVSCKEIAEQLGLSESVVQNRAAKGCEILRDYCEKHNIVLDDYDDEVFDSATAWERE